MQGLIVWGVLELSKLRGDVNKLVDALCEDFGLCPVTRREMTLSVREADDEKKLTREDSK